MIFLCKRLGLGVGLIGLISVVLLATDRDRRSDPGVKRVALLQHASSAIVDDAIEGVIAGLAEKGFREGKKLRLTRYNAEGDVGTAATIAREILHGPYDLVITLSTPSFQAVAGANKDRRMLHVFGLVGDPFSAGVGLDRAHPGQKPSYLTGQGIMLPVNESFRLARQINPALRNVGVVWNPSEANSVMFTRKAREICRQLDINLLEATVDNSAGILEAVHAVIGRGAQAIWIGGDNTVSSAIDTVVSAARKARIPAFSITPGKPDRGTLFDVGANFNVCGKLTGNLAGDILKGTDPASVPIRDVIDLVPQYLVVNRLALKGLKGEWKLPEAIVRRASVVVDEHGIREKKGGKKGGSHKQ
jgi:putative ABC transport system substrate-binding protein